MKKKTTKYYFGSNKNHYYLIRLNYTSLIDFLFSVHKNLVHTRGEAGCGEFKQLLNKKT